VKETAAGHRQEFVHPAQRTDSSLSRFQKISVKLFLEGKINFIDIPKVIEKTVEKLAPRWKDLKRHDIPSAVKEAYGEALKGLTG
jgi:orotidine-5'-phosphate decarboxylase